MLMCSFVMFLSASRGTLATKLVPGQHVKDRSSALAVPEGLPTSWSHIPDIAFYTLTVSGIT